MIARYSTGDVKGALRVSTELVRRKPDMALGRMHRAFVLRQSGDLGAAIAELRQALSLNPSDTDVVALLGVYLSEAGRFKEAVPLLQPYARSQNPDVEVLVAHGMNLAGTGAVPRLPSSKRWVLARLSLSFHGALCPEAPLWRSNSL